MADYQVKLSPAAREDLHEIWAYTEHTWGEEQADAYIRHLHQAIESLRRAADRGRRYDHVRDGYQAVGSGKHLVFYRIDSAFVWVVRILHERMDLVSQLGGD